jgi:hypothetical protein
MPALRRAIAIGISLSAATPAGAAPPAHQPQRAIGELEGALPTGWSLLATGSELVIRHDKPCYVTSPAAAHRPAGEARAVLPAGGGPLVTIELRYRLEPRWTAQQLIDARAANDRIAGELGALASRYRIDAIHRRNGQPVAVNADEQGRLDAYSAGRARLTARLIALPRCTLDDVSVFDGADTYAQLALQVDPPDAMAEARRVVELVAQYCR